MRSYRTSLDVSPIAITNVPLFFVTVTPVLRTSAGSRPKVLLTWFCTSLAARSMLRSRLNVQTIVLVPSLVVVELM